MTQPTSTPPPPLYRAEKLTEALRNGEAQRPRTSMRLPSNVPYVVDNLWEYLRPEHMPSRRHSIYASSTRDLAVASCSAIAGASGFCVYELLVEGPIKLAQLDVADARFHPDVRAVQRLVQSTVAGLQRACVEDRQAMGLIFLPGASPGDWNHATETSSMATSFIKQATEMSTFWKSASARLERKNGEVFLELAPDATYRPRELQAY